PALNLGQRVAIAEPVHGSAPDIAGQGIANPAGAILGTALLLRHYCHMPQEADRIEHAVYTAFDQGIRTADLGGKVSTQELADKVVSLL
ncbi:MAG TPA: isocitrate/isopropylmalate family dehydrogenase, partial [Anaerolineae bacterium]